MTTTKPPTAAADVNPAVKGSRAQRLAEQAREAAEVRAYQTHPDVVALQAERIRRVVDRLIWGAVILGLAFTAANVQQFAAAGAPLGSLSWVTAWLLDPMVSLVVLGILLAESVTSRWQVHTGGWVRAAKWGALGATYTMNTWASWAHVFGSHFSQGWDRVVLHSVPPATVLLAAEAVTTLRDRLTEAVLVAARRAAAAHTAAATGEHPAEPPAQPPAVSTPAPVSAPLTSPAEHSRVIGSWDEHPPRVEDWLSGEHRNRPLNGPLPAPLSGPARPEDPPAHNGHNGFRPAPPARPEPVPAAPAAPAQGTPPVSSPQANGDETADETPDETATADSEARMRAFWDAEVAEGRVPSGTQLAKAGDVSPATGRRRRATWENELASVPGADRDGPGGDRDE